MIKHKKVTPVILTIFTILLCCAMIFPAFAANDVPESVSGTRKTLTFVVYKDSDPNAPKTAAQEKAIISQVKDYMYGAAGKDISNDTQVYGPDDSLRGWYYRSSYGKLDITGNVYILHISKNEENTHLNYSALLNLAYKKYKTQINWDSYFVRSNNAQYPTIKGVYFIQGSEYSVFLSSDGFALGDVTTTSVNDSTTHEPIFYADCTGFAYLTSRHILNDNRGVLKVVAHETCHMFGFPDIYDIAGKNEDGACATTIMDNYTNTDLNDIPSIYKYLLGWMDAKIVELDGDTYTEKLQTSSYQNKLLGNQLLIIKLYESGDGRNASTMFYAVEYLTKEYNNNFGGVRVWLIETKNGTLEDWRNDVLSNSNNGRIYVSDHISYIKALSAEGETSYLLKPGMKINDSTTPAFKIPSGMNYYYQHDGAPHDSVAIRDWRNSNYQLSVDSYQNANRTVMITLKSLSKNVLTLNYISDGKTYTKNTYTNGTTFTVKTDTSLKLKKDGYLFVGWDLEMKSSDKKYDVTIATFKGGETITPATIGKAIMESNRNHHPTVYPLSLMEASFSANLVAKWRKAINVTIDPNGGKINGKTDKQVKVLPEHERIILDTPVGETFTATFKNGTTTKSTIKATRAFLCWNVIDQDTNVGHNSLYDYENTYISSENGINQLFLAQYDLPQITMPEALTKTGYIFRGWKDTQTNTIYTAKQKALLKKNTTYSAVWEKTYPYTLTVYKNESEYNSSKVTLPSATRDGYTLLGWAETSTATTAKYKAKASVSIAANKTFYAVWEKNCEHLNQKVETTTQKATCLSGGYKQTVITCTDCNKVLSTTDEKINQIVHTLNDKQEPICYYTIKENEKKGNCTTPASWDETTYCKECGIVVKKIHWTAGAPTHGQTEVITETTPATCISYGHTSYKKVCKDCGAVLSGSTTAIAPIDHGVNSDGMADCYEIRYDQAKNRYYMYCTECKCEVGEVNYSTHVE